MRRLLITGLIAITAVAIATAVHFSAQATETPLNPSRTLYVGVSAGRNVDFTSIQAAIDYAASQGAEQHQTMGTTEQGGNPWVVVVLPGDYSESGIVMRSGVNIASLGERTVLIASDLPSPIFTCGVNVTISGVTIAQANTNHPALLVNADAIQCSVHRSIIEGVNVAIRQESGFLRMFETDIRNGYADLAPAVNYPIGNPVGMNFVRSRLWQKPIRISGANNALLMLQQSHLDGVGITSTATGNVIGKFSGNTSMGTVVNSGTYRYEISNSEIASLVVSNPLGGADVKGGHIGAVTTSGGAGQVTWDRGFLDGVWVSP